MKARKFWNSKNHGNRGIFLNIGLDNCDCNEYVSANGYGNCKKVYGKGPICYVNQPSTCQDLRNSNSDVGKQYSWEACKQLPGNIKYYSISFTAIHIKISLHIN